MHRVAPHVTTTCVERADAPVGVASSQSTFTNLSDLRRERLGRRGGEGLGRWTMSCPCCNYHAIARLQQEHGGLWVEELDRMIEAWLSKKREKHTLTTFRAGLTLCASARYRQGG